MKRKPAIARQWTHFESSGQSLGEWVGKIGMSFEAWGHNRITLSAAARDAPMEEVAALGGITLKEQEFVYLPIGVGELEQLVSSGDLPTEAEWAERTNRAILNLYENVPKFIMFLYNVTMINHMRETLENLTTYATELSEKGSDAEANKNGSDLLQETISFKKRLTGMVQSISGEKWYSKSVVKQTKETYMDLIKIVNKITESYNNDPVLGTRRKFPYGDSLVDFGGYFKGSPFFDLEELLYFWGVDALANDPDRSLFKPKTEIDLDYLSQSFRLTEGLLVGHLKLAGGEYSLGDVLTQDAKDRLKKRYEKDPDHIKLPSLKIKLPEHFVDAMAPALNNALPEPTSVLQYRPISRGGALETLTVLMLTPT